MNTEKTKLAVWVSTSGGKIPDNAIRTGYEKGGKLLFIARAKMRGKWTSAKCGPYLPGAHIPYNCKEIIVKNYDVFVYPINAVRFLNWQQSSGEKVPEKAFKTNTDLYVGRANYIETLFCIISAPATSVLT